MVRVNVNTSTEEPEQKKFEMPSEGEHLLQIVDIIPNDSDSIVITKLEVAEGEEIGRTLLHRVNIDSEWNGFFLTRLFLKSIQEPYKGEFYIDSDNWIGKCFYAKIIHNVSDKNGKTYANIDEFLVDKKAEQVDLKQNKDRQEKIKNNELAWDE